MALDTWGGGYVGSLGPWGHFGVDADHSTSRNFTLSCPTTTWCAAADNFGDTFTFNGELWSANADIDPANADGANTLACATPDRCTDVDAAGNTLYFDGTTWSTPAPIDSGPLLSLDCRTNTSCVAGDLHGNVLGTP